MVNNTFQNRSEKIKKLIDTIKTRKKFKGVKKAKIFVPPLILFN